MAKRSLRFALLAAIVCLAAAAPAASTVPGFNGKIVFSSFPKSCRIACGQFVRIFLVNPDGSGLRQIISDTPMETPSRIYDEDPRWSPDGTRIAFTRYLLDSTGSIVDQHVYTADANGNQLHEVGPGWGLGWLTDNRLIREDPFTGSVTAVDAESGQPIASFPALTLLQFAFAPDGTRVAYADAGVSVMNPDGTQRERLTGPDPSLAVGEFSWAPDGSRIVYNCQGPLQTSICSIREDGTDFRSLTPAGEPQGSAWPIVSPDGRQVAFSRRLAGPESPGLLWLMNIDGSDQRQLVDQRSNTIDWQPLHAVFSPFDPPVANGSTNRANPGQAVPLKFTLGGEFGSDIFWDGYPRSAPASCTETPAQVPATAGVPAVGQLKETGRRYMYLWKTDPGFSGCRALTIRLRDGGHRTLLFSFSR